MSYVSPTDMVRRSALGAVLWTLTLAGWVQVLFSDVGAPVAVATGSALLVLGFVGGAIVGSAMVAAGNLEDAEDRPDPDDFVLYDGESV